MKLLLTNEVLPGVGVLSLFPAPRPGHENGVVFHAPQPCRLDQVGETIPQVRGHHHVAETFGTFCVHGRLDILHQVKRNSQEERE